MHGVFVISLWSPQQQRNHTMHARQVSHKILFNTLSWIHKTRLTALEECLLAAIDGKVLSVTGIGRSIDSDAKEKNCIKRADRLLSNPHLHLEHRNIYHAVMQLTVGNIQRPVILVDWSDLDPSKHHFLIRAAVALDGRSHTLYEQVHTIKTKEKPSVHKAFMRQLKSMLPANCHPIVVTDAGFKTPWFRLVKSLGWDYLGRIRGQILIQKNENSDWSHAKELYPSATTTPQFIGCLEMNRSAPFHCQMVLYKGRGKGRHKLNRAGICAASKLSKVHSAREREPWILATSLPLSSTLAKKCVQLYSTRMQIEESFRDMKSYRYGIGFSLNLSHDLKRLQTLIMIAMLANLVLWLLGTVAEKSGSAQAYQANTVKNRRVLSIIFLGQRVANDRRFTLDHSQLDEAYRQLVKLIGIHGYDC